MQHFGDKQSIMEISIDSRGLTGFETESWSYLFLSVGVNPYILTLVCTSVCLESAKPRNSYMWDYGLQGLEGLNDFKSHYWFFSLGLIFAGRVLVFTFFLLLFSSSTVFLVLKFACQGQHLKKLVAGLGASNIIKAGMSFRFVPLFYSVTKEKRTIFSLFFYLE